MLSVQDAVAKITEHPAPVIFLDTCVLLDIIRAPARNVASEVRAAMAIREASSKKPPTVHLVLGYPVRKEWADHYPSVILECERSVDTVLAFAEIWSFLGTVRIPTIPSESSILPTELKNLSEQLLTTAIELDKDAEAFGLAIDRLIQAKLPAREGGRGVKDCLILEQSLGLTRALRAQRFTHPCIFASSNMSDFAFARSNRPHPMLAPDFNDENTRLTYAFSLSAAFATLRSSGWTP